MGEAMMDAWAQEVVAGGEVYRSGWAQLAAGRLSPFRRCSRSFCNWAAASNAEAKSHSTPRGFMSDSLSLGVNATDPVQVVVREATLADYWDVADTHCGAFLPELVFPMDAIMRLDRVVAMVGGLPLPAGCQRKCLVAVSGQYHDGLDHAALLKNFLLGLKLSNDQSQTDNQLASVLGVLTVDTLADFIPRRKPTGSRRTGIAYISNVAVRQTARRKGIGKRLVQEAEIIASHWGCRSIALHCDKFNVGALALYVGAGYKAVKAPVDAKWPTPKAATGLQFGLMLKLLGST